MSSLSLFVLSNFSRKSIEHDIINDKWDDGLQAKQFLVLTEKSRTKIYFSIINLCIIITEQQIRIDGWMNGCMDGWKPRAEWLTDLMKLLWLHHVCNMHIAYRIRTVNTCVTYNETITIHNVSYDMYINLRLVACAYYIL